MTLTEKQIHYRSLSVTLLLHLLLLLIVFPSFPIKEKADYRIPVEIVISELEPPKKIKKRQAESKKIASSKSVARSVAPKPKKLPGDRETPVLSQSVVPVYPKTALNNDWQGKVVLNVFVSKEGLPKSMKVQKSSGHAILDQAFIRTVKQYYRFEPKRQYGQNMEGYHVVSYTFSL